MMSTSFCGKRRGLTLVELLIAITIVSVVISISLSVLFSARGVQRRFEDKYACEAEADRVVKEMEISLRLARELITATCSTLTFLDVHSDTCMYYQQSDTLFRNSMPLARLAVDSLRFLYFKADSTGCICDPYDLDQDMDGVLRGVELNGVSGINLKIHFLHAARSHTLQLRRGCSVLLRNVDLKSMTESTANRGVR
jgi:prepilin-type N-terminal cleavage/methylation domain-containing protein